VAAGAGGGRRRGGVEAAVSWGRGTGRALDSLGQQSGESYSFLFLYKKKYSFLLFVLFSGSNQK